MSLIMWITVGIGVLMVVLLAVMLLYFRKNPGKRKETDYYTFFVIGISWVPLGIVFWLTLNMPFGMVLFAIGLCWMAIGLANRDKWKTRKTGKGKKEVKQERKGKK